MPTIQEPHTRYKAHQDLNEYRSRVFHDMPAVGRLLDRLDAGTTPTFLDMIAAISELVAFYTECDTNYQELCELEAKMSGKKCLFCY